MKNLLLSIILMLPTYLFAQTVDTVIKTDIYKSYYSIKLKEPLYVSYKLYKGGGDCKRAAFHFKNDTNIPTATSKDYAASGYDEGHLANAEDFAGDCTKEEETFRFYNCVPQTANLNRGIWKHWETLIRKESQTDSLLIICGSQFSSGKILETQKTDEVAVPDYCWKVVISLTTNRVLYILYFTNSDADNILNPNLTIPQLEDKIGYKFSLTY